MWHVIKVCEPNLYLPHWHSAILTDLSHSSYHCCSHTSLLHHCCSLIANILPKKRPYVSIITYSVNLQIVVYRDTQTEGSLCSGSTCNVHVLPELLCTGILRTLTEGWLCSGSTRNVCVLLELLWCTEILWQRGNDAVAVHVMYAYCQSYCGVQGYSDRGVIVQWQYM